MGSQGWFRLLRQRTQLFSVVVLLLGVLFLAAYYGLSPTATRPSVAALAFYVLATILISSGIINVLLSRVVIEESREHTREMVKGVLDEVLRQPSTNLELGAQRDYRWHCLLSMPDAVDPLPDHAVQEIDISKEFRIPGSEIRFICISAPDNLQLANFPENKGYVLRWLVSEILNPDDANVFSLQFVRLDGRTLKIEKRRLNVGAQATYRGVEYWCKLPKDLVDDNAVRRVAWRYRVRKEVGGDQMINIETALFAPTYGAEFRCTVGESIPLRSFGYDPLQVTGSGRPPTVTASEPMKDPTSPCTLFVRFDDSPILKGSGVTFRVGRDKASLVSGGSSL